MFRNPQPDLQWTRQRRSNPASAGEALRWSAQGHGAASVYSPGCSQSPEAVLDTSSSFCKHCSFLSSGCISSLESWNFLLLGLPIKASTEKACARELRAIPGGEEVIVRCKVSTWAGEGGRGRGRAQMRGKGGKAHRKEVLSLKNNFWIRTIIEKIPLCYIRIYFYLIRQNKREGSLNELKSYEV